MTNTPEMPRSLEDTVLRMQREILHDVVAGTVPRTVRNIIDLHNYGDMHAYGGFTQDAVSGPLIAAFGGLTNGAFPKGFMDFMHEARDRVDLWLRDGGLERDSLPPGWTVADDFTKEEFDPWGYKSQKPVYELTVRAEGVPTLGLMVLQEGAKFIGVHGDVKMDAFDSPKEAAGQSVNWGLENGWSEEVMRQALWPDAKASLKVDHLVFTVGTGDGWNCHTPDGLGIRLDPVGRGVAWDWSASRSWMDSCGTGQAETRDKAIVAAASALVDAGLSIDVLPSLAVARPEAKVVAPEADDLAGDVSAANQTPPQDDDAFDAYVVNGLFSKIERVEVMEGFLLRAARRFHVLGQELASAINAQQDLPDLKNKAWAFLADQFMMENNDLRMFFSETEDFHQQSPQERKRLYAVADALLCSGKDASKIAHAEKLSPNPVEKAVLIWFNDLMANAHKQVGAAHTFCLVAKEMLAPVQGDTSAVDWNAFHNEVIQRSIVRNKQPWESVQTVLFECSPGAITPEQRALISVDIHLAIEQRERGAKAPNVQGLER